MPFLREGIKKSDDNAVNRYDSEAAACALTDVLVAEYKSLFKYAVLNGNNLDAVLSYAKKENNDFFTDMEEKFTIRIRKAISILNVLENKNNLTDFCRVWRRRIYKVSTTSLRDHLDQKVNIAMGQTEPYIVFDDFNPLIPLELTIRNRCRTIIENECYA